MLSNKILTEAIEQGATALRNACCDCDKPDHIHNIYASLTMENHIIAVEANVNAASRVIVTAVLAFLDAELEKKQRELLEPIPDLLRDMAREVLAKTLNGE
jgi:SHS2 domain-containing protein